MNNTQANPEASTETTRIENPGFASKPRPASRISWKMAFMDLHPQWRVGESHDSCRREQESHSLRRASSGAMRAARNVGIAQATRAITASKTATLASKIGLVALVP